MCIYAKIIDRLYLKGKQKVNKENGLRAFATQGFIFFKEMFVFRQGIRLVSPDKDGFHRRRTKKKVFSDFVNAIWISEIKMIYIIRLNQNY